MINITVGEILNSQESLQKLATAQLPISASYKLARGLKQIDEELKNFYAMQQKMATKYGTKDDNGELIVDDSGNTPIKAENQTLFQEEMQDLLAVEVSLNMDPISVENLDNISMSAQELFWLDRFLA